MPTDLNTVYDEEIRGLDTLELPRSEPVPLPIRMWKAAWPKLAAVAIGLGVWQLVVASGWKPPWVLPPPATVLGRLAEEAGTTDLWAAVATTLQRAGLGFATAVILGTVIGLTVSQSRILRSAVGSFITGLQTMPSIVWFPIAILVFGLTETAILFVVVIGGAPAVANGLIAGIDHIPPILLRAGHILGARGPVAWRHVVLPAALPAYVAGLKQGWAFAWRSLMAGELLVIIAERPSLGVSLHFARELADAAGLQASMIVVLIIGLLVDGVFFGTLERAIRRNRGLIVTK
jgi:NitT/TauT family transport system permease protein